MKCAFPILETSAKSVQTTAKSVQTSAVVYTDYS